MRKRSLLLVTGMLAAAVLTGCGGGSTKTTEAPATEATTQAKEATTEATEAEATEADTEAVADTDTVKGPWWDYSDVLTVPYLGESDAGELAVFVASDDMSFAVLGVADPETLESVSFVGDLTEDEDTGYLTITDETNGMTLTFEVIDNGDDTFTLDMGDTGALTIAACDQADAFEALDTLDQYTTAVDGTAGEDSSTETAEGSWWDYSDVLTVPYMGMSDAGEVAAFVASDDMSFAVLGVANPETGESVSFVGDLTEDEDTGYLTITDETNGMTLTFEVVDNGDDTFTLDMGDTGSLTITACTQDEAFEILDTLDQYTEPVA